MSARLDSQISPPDTTLPPDSKALEHRVLVAVHTDEQRRRPLLRVATHLAAVRRSQLTMLTVLEQLQAETPLADASSLSSPATVLSPETLHVTQTLLASAIAQAEPEYLTEPKRSMCDIQILAGDPGDEIPNLLTSSHADILVIGRGEVGHTDGVLGVILQGMRTTQMYQASQTPVIAVADPSDGRHPLDTVVVTTDLSGASWNAAAVALQGAPAGAQIHVVHMTDEIIENPLAGPEIREAIRMALDAWSESLRQFLPCGATLQTTIVDGESYDTLATFLTAVKATCVAVGGHGVTVAGGTLTGQLVAMWAGSLIVSPCKP